MLLITYNFSIENKYPSSLPSPLHPIAPHQVLAVKSNRKLKKFQEKVELTVAKHYGEK